MSTWTRRQRIKNDLIFVLAWIATTVVRPLPKPLLRALGSAVGWMAWAFAGDARRTAIENLRVSLPERDAPRLARRTFVELGALLGDTLALLREGEPAGLPFIAGSREVLERARAAGRGVVLVTAHLGPWERLAAALVEAGFPLTTPVRASYDPRLERHIVGRLRRGRGVDAIDRDAPGAPRALVRALRRGDVAGFLVDVDTRVASVAAPFFGRLARTPSGAARLAIGTGAPVVAAFATREGIAVEILREASPRARATDGATDGSTDGAVLALVSEMNRAIERAIAREPERWIWMHPRVRAEHKTETSPAGGLVSKLR